MITASHVAHGDVMSALCPILLILWIVLLILGVVGLVTRRPFLLDPAGSLIAAVVLLVVWAVLC